MSHPSFNNIGAYLKCIRSVSASAIAAGSGDATETTGAYVDRLGFQSANAFLMTQATVSSGKKATFKMTLQHGDTDGSGAADAGATLQPEGAADSVVETLSYVTGTEYGSYDYDIDLSSLGRYILLQVHVDLDNSGTDVAFYCGGFILGGKYATPIT